MNALGKGKRGEMVTWMSNNSQILKELKPWLWESRQWWQSQGAAVGPEESAVEAAAPYRTLKRLQKPALIWGKGGWSSGLLPSPPALRHRQISGTTEAGIAQRADPWP